MDSQEESMDCWGEFEKERKKVKNIRKNYTIKKIKIVLDYYDKVKSIR